MCEAAPSWSFSGCFWVWQVSSRVAGCWTPTIVQTKKGQPGTPPFPWYLISTQRLSYLVWLRNSLPLKLFFAFVFQDGNRKFSLLYLHRYAKIWFHLTLKNPRTPLPKKPKPNRKAPNPKSKNPWVLLFWFLWEIFPTPQCQAVEKLYCWSSSAVLYLICVIIMESSTSISLLKMCFPKKPVKFNILTRALEHQCLSCIPLTFLQPKNRCSYPTELSAYINTFDAS